ncbi:hypothetical protein E2R68_11060 [Psychromonas sp. RZ22]|uniref:hypothetical protein n=1 Tax=Psychromonas algarum TaxID=2555643 RepID=UPI00106789E8|nr:hypothetical protein [Psychromonas sp. RZ22]TEW53689.1 hypothetical protein E2R68_11060 [Psychromonas sp. RZ22]
MLTKSRLIQLLIMLSLLIGLFVWRTIDSSITEKVDNSDNKLALNIVDNVCDFTKPCAFKSVLGTFYLSVDEGEIIPEEWFHLTLKSELNNWQVISAKIIGKSMFMGHIPVIFSPVNEKGIQQSHAKTMVGSCTEDKMLWQLEVVVDLDGQTVNLAYDFLISR